MSRCNLYMRMCWRDATQRCTNIHRTTAKLGGVWCSHAWCAPLFPHNSNLRGAARAGAGDGGWQGWRDGGGGGGMKRWRNGIVIKIVRLCSTIPWPFLFPSLCSECMNLIQSCHLLLCAHQLRCAALSQRVGTIHETIGRKIILMQKTKPCTTCLTNITSYHTHNIIQLDHELYVEE